MCAKKTLLRQASSALGWSLLGSLARAIAAFVFQVILARVLGPHVYGQFAIVMGVLAVGWLIADSGFGASLIQKPTVDDDDIGFALTWVAISGLVIAIVTAISANTLAIAFDDSAIESLLYGAAILIPIQAITNISTSLLKRDLRQKTIQLAQFTGYFIGMALFAIPLAIAGFGSWSLLVGVGVQTIISLVWIYLSSRHSICFRLSGNQEMRKFGVAVLGSNILNAGIDYFDKLIIAGAWGVRSAGLYTNSMNLARAPLGIFLPPLQSTIFAVVARQSALGGNVASIYIAALNACSLIAMPLFAWLAVNAKDIVTFLYGSTWLESVPLFRIISLSMPLFCVAAISGSTLMGLGKGKEEFYSQLIVFSILLLGLYILANHQLKIAVWIVVLAYGIRAMILCRVVMSKSGAKLIRVLQALTGGLIIGMVSPVVNFFYSEANVSFLYGSLIASASMQIAAWLFLVVGCWRFFVTPELASLLQSALPRFPKIGNMLIALKNLPK